MDVVQSCCQGDRGDNRETGDSEGVTRVSKTGTQKSAQEGAEATRIGRRHYSGPFDAYKPSLLPCRMPNHWKGRQGRRAGYAGVDHEIG